jgi:hypothetical protein
MKHVEKASEVSADERLLMKWLNGPKKGIQEQAKDYS